MMAHVDTSLRTALTGVLLALLGAGAVSAWFADRINDRVWTLTFSPHGRHLAVTSDAGVSLYDPTSAARKLKVSRGRLAAFTTDGGRMAVATPDTIVVVELTRYERICEFPGQGDWTTSLAFSPNGQLLAALADESNTLQVWDIATETLQWSVQAHEDADLAIAFSPDGRLLATGGSDRKAKSSQLRLWAAERGDLKQTIEIPRWAYAKEAVFVDGGDALMVVFSAGPNLVYDISNLEDIQEIAGHPLGRLTGHVVPSPDGRYAATRGKKEDAWASSVAVVDLSTGQTVLDTDPTHGLWWGAAFGESSKSLSVATSAGTVTTWDLASDRRTSTVEGNRAPRRSAVWFVLAGLMIVWLAVWIVSHVRRRNQVFNNLDWLLVPVVGASAVAIIAAFHWILIQDPWTSPDPLGYLEALARWEIACMVGFVLVTAVTRSFRALVTTIVIFATLLLITAGMWTLGADSI